MRHDHYRFRRIFHHRTGLKMVSFIFKRFLNFLGFPDEIQDHSLSLSHKFSREGITILHFFGVRTDIVVQ